jgi:hypothetical protein
MDRPTQVALAALVFALAALLVRRHYRSWQARRRCARAGRGEVRAAQLLTASGFRIVEQQPRVSWAPLVDGEPHHVELRADYLVERDRELLVAEVKTGADATSLRTAATRRQLLVYHVAFGADGVLLVCPERETIQRIAFALRARRG